MSLSIIIVSWNTCALLQSCLQTIRQEVQGSPDLDIDVLVVDNASADDSAQMVSRNFPEITLLQNPDNLGFARANNQGIRASRGDYVLLLNSDTELSPGALEALGAFMATHPKAGAAGARLFNTDGTLQAGCHPMLTPAREFWRLLFLDRLWPRANYPLASWDKQTPHQVEVIKGAALMLRRAALDQVGLLDEQYHMYTEEVDLCYRLSAAGWGLWYVPQAVVVHHGAASSRQMAQEMYVQLYRSKVQFYRKFGGERRANEFKRLVRLGYWPRLVAHRLAGIFSPVHAEQALTCRRLLADLPSM